MAKPNSFIDYLDNAPAVTRDGALAALKGVPFLSHQYDWFLSEVAKRPVAGAVDMLAGYTGVKRRDGVRVLRLETIAILLGAKG